MSIRCNQVQDALAENRERHEDIDLESVLQAHLSECEECSEIEATLGMLDDQLSAMPGIEPPDALVAQLLSAAVDVKPTPLQVVRESSELIVDSDKEAEMPRRPLWGGAVGIGGMLAAAAGIALVATSNWSGARSEKAVSDEFTTQRRVSSRDIDFERQTPNAKPLETETPPILDPQDSNGDWMALDDTSIVARFDGQAGAQSPDEVQDIDANTRRQLESLGYFGGDTSEQTGTAFQYKQVLERTFDFSEGLDDLKAQVVGASKQEIARNSAIDQARKSGVLGVYRSTQQSEADQGIKHDKFHGNESGRFDESDIPNSALGRGEVLPSSGGKGKNKEDEISFSGSSSLENDYIVDGVNTKGRAFDFGEVSRDAKPSGATNQAADGSKTTGLFWGNRDSEKTAREQTLRKPTETGGGAFASLIAPADFSSGLDDKDVYGGLLGNEVGEIVNGWGKDVAGAKSNLEEKEKEKEKQGERHNSKTPGCGPNPLCGLGVERQHGQDGKMGKKDSILAAGQHAIRVADEDGRVIKREISGKREQRIAEKNVRLRSVVEAKALRDVAQAFLAQKDDVSAATIVSDGFWSNNYIPDSPGLRLLASRLASDPTEAELGSLDSDFSPYEPKLDAPRNSALGISVRSDKRVTDGPTRMLLQVGIKGTAKKPGRRAALNIGVVLDLSGHTSSKQVQETMRKLLKSLRSAKQSGDRFSLTIANAPGGLLLTPKQFRNGPLTVAMRDLFSDGISEKRAEQPTLGLAQAVMQATAQVTLNDDPSAPLGRSSVLLVTAAAASAANHQGLLQLAQANTSKGIGFSAIGIGQGIDDAQLTELAGAGHGHRRLVLKTSKASSVIADTLADAESVVARAVRVRVKLAPGVKLVEVVGSQRLNADAARRTRAAEKSIDKRIDRAQGIKSDREQDEEGIKIIIPSFAAGESHVILLDVIVPGAGAVADVSVSYKDLVHLRNGKSKTSLSIARGTPASGQDKVGALERGVFRNYVGLEVAQELKTAGRLLSTGQDPAAHAVIIKLHDLLLGLRNEYSWLQRDTVFARDLRAVQRFRELLSKLDSVSVTSKSYIAQSLNYSGWRKIVQAPAVNNTTR